MVVALVVGPERRLGPDEQRLGGALRAAEARRHLADGEPVEVAQGERAPVLGRQVGQGPVGDQRVELDVPRVLAGLALVAGVRVDRLELALLALPAPPVVDELVPGDADQPRHGQVRHGLAPDRVDRGQERLGGQVLGDGRGPAP